VIWVVEGVENDEDCRQRNESEHNHVMGPLIIVAIVVTVTVTYPVLQHTRMHITAQGTDFRKIII